MVVALELLHCPKHPLHGLVPNNIGIVIASGACIVVNSFPKGLLNVFFEV